MKLSWNFSSFQFYNLTLVGFPPSSSVTLGCKLSNRFMDVYIVAFCLLICCRSGSQPLISVIGVQKHSLTLTLQVKIV